MSHKIIHAHEPHPDLDELHSRVHQRTKHIHQKNHPDVPHEQHDEFHHDVSKHTARRIHKLAPRVKEILASQLHLYEQIVDVVTDVLIEDYLEEKFMDHPELHPHHPSNQESPADESQPTPQNPSSSSELQSQPDTLLAKLKKFVS